MSKRLALLLVAAGLALAGVATWVTSGENAVEARGNCISDCG